jgi:DNA-binding transcriptional ArsR family regulator
MVLRAEHSVGELAEACEIPSNMASEHLRLMEARGLVKGDRRGRRAYYKVQEPYLESIMACIEHRFGGEERK